MAETKVGGVHVSASIGTAEYTADAKKLKAETVALERSLKSSFGGMGAAVKGFGGALTAGLSIGLLGGLAKKALDFAAAIGTTAKQLGVTTKELQLFRHAAGQVGVKQAEADKGLERLGVTLGKAAAGSTTATKALAAVGVSLQDIQTKTRTEIFAQIADQMNRQGGAAKNAAAGVAIMGEGFGKLIPLADKGSKGINELSQAAERLGIVLSDDQIQRADETAQKLEDVRAVLSAQIAGVVADNAASIVSLAGALASLTSSIVNFLGSNPQAALAILGAMAGSRFGLPGAAAGAFAGALAGGKIARDAANANMDPRFRAQQIRAAQAALAKAKSGAGDPTGKLGANPAAIKAAEKELARQTALGRAALARKSTTAAGTAAIPQFLAPAPKGGGRKRTPRAPKDTSLRDAFQFDQELRRSQMDVLRATQSLSTDYSERATIAVQLLDMEKAAHEAELKYRVASDDISETQAQQLRLEYDKKDALERQAIMADEAAQRAEDAARLDMLSLELDRNKLQSEGQLAETAAEQRSVQLRLLDLAYRMERARLEAVIADEQSSYAAKEEARRRLQGLNETQANDRAAVMQGTRPPLEEYAASLPLTAAKMNEALESVAVNGLRSLEDGIISVIDGTKSLGEAFRDMASGIIAELLRISIQKAIIAPLAAALFPGKGFEAGGFTGFATGGFTGWGNPKSIAGVVHKREGVLNVRAMQQVGIPTLNALNRGAPVPVSNDNRLGGAPIHIHMSGPMTDRQARQTGMQAAAGFKAEIARSAKQGY
jgi:hypothetical protein